MPDSMVFVLNFAGLFLVLVALNRMEKRMTQQLDNVNAALARLKASVQKEIQQLADALAAAINADAPADIQKVADGMNALADSLDADDPAPAPAPAP